MAQYDLTHELCKNLDRHLAFPLLEFLSNKQIYDDTDIQKSKIDLLQKTNMVDYAAEIYTALYNTDEIPEEMNTRRKSVVAKLKTLQVSSTVDIVNLPSSSKEIKENEG
jgi:translation initiation factor 3 subunit E